MNVTWVTNILTDTPTYTTTENTLKPWDTVEKVDDWKLVRKFQEGRDWSDGHVHYYPTQDFEPHKLNACCWCNPVYSGWDPKREQEIWHHRIALQVPN